jgi:hypothetical protein
MCWLGSWGDGCSWVRVFLGLRPASVCVRRYTQQGAPTPTKYGFREHSVCCGRHRCDWRRLSTTSCLFPNKPSPDATQRSSSSRPPSQSGLVDRDVGATERSSVPHAGLMECGEEHTSVRNGRNAGRRPKGNPLGQPLHKHMGERRGAIGCVRAQAHGPRARRRAEAGQSPVEHRQRRSRFVGQVLACAGALSRGPKRISGRSHARGVRAALCTECRGW